MWSRNLFFICNLLLLGTALSEDVKNTKVGIQKYFGAVTWQAGSGEKQIKCRATDVVSTDDRTGQFEWRLGGEVSISSTFRIQQLLHAKIPEAQKRHNQVVLEYEPKIQDNGKVLICSFKYLDDFGELLHSADSDAVKINIESNKFPKSPFQAGSYLPGQPVEFVIEFEQFPDPASENVVWVVKGNDDQEQEFIPGQKDKTGKYQAGQLKSLGDHKFSTSFTINSADEDEVNKDHYLRIRGSDLKKTDKTRIDVAFTLQSAREPAPTTTTTTTTTVKDQEGEITEEPQAAQLNVGIIIIMVLVILIILICIGYCIYKKYGRKPEPRDPQAQDTKTGKGEYQPAPTNDTENPA